MNRDFKNAILFCKNYNDIKLMRLTALFLFIPVLLNAQSSNYAVSSFQNEGVKAPNTHHIGEAWLNALVEADDAFTYNITQATFSANSTLDWHKHATAQVIIVIEGEGYYQERGKEPMLMKVGDVIKCPKDTEHWHTASAENDVSYLAIYGSDPTTWTETLTREEYNKVAEQLRDH